MHFLQVIDVGLFFGLTAFVLQITGYIFYSFHIFRGRTQPNASSWFMWLVGGVIEYLTFDAIGESHISTSALPLACVIGLVILFSTTLIMQLRAEFYPERHKKVSYHAPERSDYFLTSFDIGAGLLWVFWNVAALANFLAVSTSILSFIPIWKTTYRHNKEDAAPWLIWCLAYSCMFVAVLFDGNDALLSKSFYPLYYLFLHLVVLLLCLPRTRIFRYLHSN